MLTFGLTIALALAAPEQTAEFSAAAAVLETHCVRCHNPREKKGGLTLDTLAGLRAGGDSGPALDLKQPEASLLLEMVRGDKPEMPKGAPPLSPAETAALARWLASGAAWPEGKQLTARTAYDRTWWSLQPLHAAPPPAAEKLAPGWPSRPLDLFIARQLHERALAPSPPASRAVLLRRLTFDLVGLPPTVDEVDAFAASRAPDALERAVDRLLAAPGYGERWARHWLDVVHFGETHGYDKDKPRPSAWPYRDYVIAALNRDLPYGRFVREQIAGDRLSPGDPNALVALGFLAAGPWDFIGHAEVPETKLDGKVARHLDRDDMVQTAVGVVNSLTVGCAQCHDHKFDPILQTDYYRLQAVFAAIDRADRKYFADPALAARSAELERRQAETAQQLAQVQADVAAAAGDKLSALDAQIAAAQKPAPAAARPPEFGYHSQIAPQMSTTKWVQVDLGQVQTLEEIVLFPCHDDFAGIGAGFGFPPRLKIELATDADFTAGVQRVADETAADRPQPGLEPQVFPVGGKRGRYVRITATKLALRQNDYIFALAELEARTAGGKNLARGAPVAALDSIEAPVRWRKSNLTDGLAPAGKTAPVGDTSSLAELSAAREKLLRERAPAALRARFDQLTQQQAALAAERAKLPPPSVVYIGAVHTGSGAFSGTGASGGQPRKIFVLSRGDVKSPGPEVGPGALSCLSMLPGEFALPPGHNEADRRAALAEWLASEHNPLTWRSIANRVWQYHFGRGLVETPGDFGRMGGLPSHPELLDYLARDLLRHGGSLKRLHRELAASAAYQQVSTTAHGAARDAQNQSLWRMPRRKLEAEAVRDAILHAAGRLHSQMGGPSFQDFVIEQPAHSPHYRYDLFDPGDARSHRRSIYRFLVRSQPQPFMTCLDCADPSLRVDRRNESLAAAQALALLNNGLVVSMAKQFAARLAEEAADDLPGQIRLAFGHALSRRPTADELLLLTDYARQHGLPAACRVLLNLNEFAFVD